jgi:hypothetical protein
LPENTNASLREEVRSIETMKRAVLEVTQTLKSRTCDQNHAEKPERGTVPERIVSPAQTILLRGRNANPPPQLQTATPHVTGLWPVRQSPGTLDCRLSTTSPTNK